MTASIGRNLNDIEKQYDLLSGLFSKKSVCGISDNSFFATLINATDSMAIKLSENQMVKVNTPFVKTGKQDIAVSVEDNRGRSLTDVILNVADSMAIKLTDDEIAAIIKNMTAEKPQSIEKNKQEFVLNNNYGMIFPVATMSKEVLSFLKAISPDTSNNTQKIVTKTETETLIASEGETDTSREIIKGIMIRITPVEVEFAGNDKTGPSINVFSLKEDHSSEGENGDIDKFFFLPVEQNVNGVFNSATFILNVVKKVLSEISITEYPGINEEVKRNLYGLEKINTKKINLASVLPEINIPDVSVEKNMIFMDINTNTRQPTEVDKSHNADLSLQKNDNFKAWNKSVTFDGNNFVPVLNNMVFFEDNKIAVFQNTDEINPQQLFTLQGQVKNSSAMYPEHKETATGIIEGLQDVEGLQDAGAEKNITAVPLVIPSKEAVGTEIKTVKAFYITAQNADLSPVDNDNSAKKGYTRQPTEVDKSHNADLSLQKNDNFKAWNKSVTFDGNNFVPVLNNMVFFEDNKIAVFQNTDEINPQQLFTLQGQVKNSSAMYPEHKETATGIIEGLQDVEGLQDAGAEKNITAVPLVIPSKEAVGTEIKTVKAFYITAQNADLSPVDNDNSAKNPLEKNKTVLDSSALLTESFLEIERSDDIERELFANPLKDIFITNQEDGEIIQHLGQVRNEETINVENSVIQQRGVWQTAVSEKIQETIDRFIEARPAPVTTIRINIEGKESFVLGLTDNRNDIAVEIKVSDPELTSVINTVKEQIIKNLEARDIKVSVYINPDNQQQQKERHKWGYNDPEQDEKSLNGDKMNFSNILKINNQGENHVGISSTEYNKFNGFKPGLFRS